jgi:hypothetical protein
LVIENNIATEELEEIDDQAQKRVLEGKKAAWNAFVSPTKEEQKN